MSGMGTTLALTGACSLADALLSHESYTEAFSVYEEEMRPIADKSQKLAPGMPRMMHPQSLLEVILLHGLMFFFDKSGIMELLAMLFGPPADKVSLKDKKDTAQET